MHIKPQSPEQRQAIKAAVYEMREIPDAIVRVLEGIDTSTIFVDKTTGVSWLCMEVQLKGVIIHKNRLRRYVSYVDFEFYEVRNGIQ